MYIEKIEPLTDADRKLCAAFKQAKGFKEERSMTSCGLGWFASYIEKDVGLSADEAQAVYHRVYFDERKEQAALFNFMKAAGGPVSAQQVVEKMEAQGYSRKQAQIAIQVALDEGGFAILDKDMKLRVMGKGDQKFIMG